MGTSTIEKVGSALGNAWREATEPAQESSPKRFRGALSGMRGVIVGVGLGVLAAKKGEPLVKSAMSKYVASQATKATDQVRRVFHRPSRRGLPGRSVAARLRRPRVAAARLASAIAGGGLSRWRAKPPNIAGLDPA